MLPPLTGGSSYFLTYLLSYISFWSEVQTCMWSSWCHCHSLSLASVTPTLVLHFWYHLTWLAPDKGPLNGCCCWYMVCGVRHGNIVSKWLRHILANPCDVHTHVCVCVFSRCSFIVISRRCLQLNASWNQSQEPTRNCEWYFSRSLHLWVRLWQAF